MRKNNKRIVVISPLMSEINITPFVDVMLVLLVVFMITAPLINKGITVNLPKVKSSKVIRQNGKSMIISINRKGKLFLDNKMLSMKKLSAILTVFTNLQKRQRKILVKGDKRLEYGKVIEVMALLKNKGFSQVALLVDNT